MKEIENRCEMAINIIRATHDGEDLDPDDLWLVQEWVNDHLNEKGEAAFRELHARVIAGNYVKPWLGEVENLTRDHQGYVYWKGIQVEHYSFANYAEMKRASVELGRRCLLLEALGVQPTCRRVTWDWEKWEQ